MEMEIICKDAQKHFEQARAAYRAFLDKMPMRKDYSYEVETSDKDKGEGPIKKSTLALRNVKLAAPGSPAAKALAMLAKYKPTSFN